MRGIPHNWALRRRVERREFQERMPGYGILHRVETRVSALQYTCTIALKISPKPST